MCFTWDIEGCGIINSEDFSAHKCILSKTVQAKTIGHAF